MNTLKLYATGAATANAVANVQMPSATRIKGVQVAFMVDSITDNAAVQIELSRASAREIATNGAQQCIIEQAIYGNFVTSGLAQFGINQFFPVDIPVIQGQLIYLHAVVTGTATYTFTGIIHWG
jgi:hypothetical protein